MFLSESHLLRTVLFLQYQQCQERQFRANQSWMASISKQCGLSNKSFPNSANGFILSKFDEQGSQFHTCSRKAPNNIKGVAHHSEALSCERSTIKIAMIYPGVRRISEVEKVDAIGCKGESGGRKNQFFSTHPTDFEYVNCICK